MKSDTYHIFDTPIDNIVLDNIPLGWGMDERDSER